MARFRAITIIPCVLVLFLLCAPALAQEQTPPTQSQQPPITTPQGGEEAPPGHVYFYLNDELSPVERNVTGGNQMAEFGMLELLKGPTEEEKAAGYVTYIPQGVKLQYSSVKNDRSEYAVNLSRELLDLKGDPERAAKALAQIEKTLQELTEISNIGITVAGEGLGSSSEDAYAALGVPKKSAQGEAEGGGKGGLIAAIVLPILGAIILAIMVFLALKRRKSSGEKLPPKKSPEKKKAKK